VSIYAPLEAAFGIPAVVQATFVAIALLALWGFAVRRQIAAANGGILPDEGVTLRNVAEMLVEMLASLGRDVIGEDWRKYFPIIGSIFFFILISNLLGLIPGIGGATSDINTTVAWAIISFVVYNAVGIRRHGVWYINQFCGPSFFTLHVGGRHIHMRLLMPLFLPLELLLHLARIVTLSIRLLANMFADHTVVSVWLGLVPIAIPAVFMGLGVLVCFLQAFVFSLLTMIYIGMALEEAH
jgi:F-type H+-transporting ATPase subunit a